MNRIYVFSPANFASGGPELLQQLCYMLRGYNYDACMCYYRYDDNKYKSPVCEAYKEYNNPYIVEEDFVDDSGNIIVLPESCRKQLFTFKKSPIVFWWLSVDNFYPADKKGILRWFRHMHLASMPVYPYIGNAKIIFNRLKGTNPIYHLAQSYYAVDYCKNKVNIDDDKIFYVSDYLNPLFIKSAIDNYNDKENIVLYNPKKGFEFTKEFKSFLRII